MFVSKADSGVKMRSLVRVGSFDDPEIGGPIGAIWTKSAPNWACFDESLPKGETGTLPAA